MYIMLLSRKFQVYPTPVAELWDLCQMNYTSITKDYVLQVWVTCELQIKGAASDCFHFNGEAINSRV